MARSHPSTYADRDPELLDRAARRLQEIKRHHRASLHRDEAAILMRDMTTARYLRVSSQKQARKYGPASQAEDIADACRRKGLRPPQLVFEDHVSAAGKLTRSDFDKARALAQTGAFSLLMVGRVDRFARDEAQGWIYIWELISLGVYVYFCDEDIAAGLEEGWQDRVSERLAAAAAVGRLIGRNVGKSVRERRHDNVHVGLMPFGWRRVDTRPVADPTEAAVVRAAFALASQDQLKVATIADQLNARGMRFRRGRLLTKSNVYEMLTNPFHTGTWRITTEGKTQELPAMHEGVIAASDFVLVQRLLRERGRSRRSPERSRARHEHIFRGLLRCGDVLEGGEICDASIAARGGRDGGRYPTYSHAEGKGCCDSGSGLLWCVSERTLATQIDDLFARAQLPESAMAVIAEYMRELESGDRPDVDALRASYEKQARRIDDAYKAGAYGHEADEKRAWQAERGSVLAQIEALPKPAQLPDGDAAALLRSVGETWSMATAQERGRILRTLFEAIYVTRQGGLDRTCTGRPRVRGTQRIASLKPYPEYELLVGYMFSGHKEDGLKEIPSS